MNTKKYIYLITTLITAGIFALAVPALAENNQGGNSVNIGTGNNVQTKTTSGTVSAISGSNITIAVKQELANVTTTVSFTVNASGASITKNGVAGVLANILIGDKISVQGTIIGTNITATTIRDGQNNQGENDSNKMSPNVVGKVTAINGNILTINRKQESDNNSSVSAAEFTVDAANAKILRGETVIAVSNIAVGDNIVVQGTLTGTKVVATLIRDGKMGNGSNNQGDNNQALLQIKGNGQPIIAGTVSVINGSMLTVANASVTYSVDATNAKIVQGKNTILLSGVKIGDSVIIQGTVSGTSVTASTIIDANTAAGQKARLGFFGSIGQWFKHLFGF